MSDNDWDLAGWLVEFPFISAVFLASSLENVRNSYSIAEEFKYCSQIETSFTGETRH